MMRWVVALAIGVGLLAPSAVLAQVGYDRYGSDYASFPVRSGDPAVCALRCEREGRCRAWSFTYPSAAAPAVCWLKNHVPPRVENNCCVSGVRGAGVVAPRRGGVEFSIDRIGGDYRQFDISPDPTGKECAQECQSDPRCRAWTYLRPGYQGPQARCFLKDRIKPPRRRPCCISGVVR
ncbi:MAG: PAN domain-containing protein [Proteobacteria bacterium]|nr:PAN domain-containing protein [Pseudomonadota bacterium]